MLDLAPPLERRVPTLLPEEVADAAEYCRALVDALPETTVLLVDGEQVVKVAVGHLVAERDAVRGSIVGRMLSECLPEGSSAMLIDHYRLALAGDAHGFEYRTANGASWCSVKLRSLYLGRSLPVAVLAIVEDVTDRRRRDGELSVERDRRRLAEEIAGVGYWDLDLSSGALTISDGAMSLLGLRADPGLTLTDVLERIDEDDTPEVLAGLNEAERGGSAAREFSLCGFDGTRRRLLARAKQVPAEDSKGAIAGTVLDLTPLRAAEQELDDVRSFYGRGFEQSPIGMSRTDRDGVYTAVNRALCHLLGRSREEILGHNFLEFTHADDLPANRSSQDALASGATSYVEFEKRYVRGDGSDLWVSVHVVTDVDGGEICGYLSQVVDITVRKAREVEQRDEALDLQCLKMIRSALAEDRLILHAQPILDLRSGEIAQQELLVRLRHPDGRVAAPAEFLPVAERYGAITEIDRWVTQRGIELAAGGQPVQVNLSGASVGNDELLADIRAALSRCRADPRLVVFEITETALTADLDRAREFATELRAIGCRFALDDFGTGFGTFTYLKHLPVDYVKIDAEFVRDLLHSEHDERLVRTMVRMAREFAITTIAEGVEDNATLQRLREVGVDQAQGYYIARPQLIDQP